MTQSGQKKILGVLINNLGTPESYRVEDVRAFLKEFLWDPRVVKMSRPIWWLVLNVIILNTRPKRSAAAYRKIWTDDGSPLLSITRKLTGRLQDYLKKNSVDSLVEMGMRYGMPSIEQGLRKLQQAGAGRFLILPLYPQFSYTTTASVEDEVARILGDLPYQDFTVNKNYFDCPDYIAALANSVKKYWHKNGQAEILLMSFHGIPRAYSVDGDPYQGQCIQTANLLAQALKLGPHQWRLSFQSRLGPKKWLEPYTDRVLQKLANHGIRSVQVICPGFSVDCLETLEEIAMENRNIFMRAGGDKYHYIPCLNDSEDQVRMIISQILEHLK